MYGRSKITTRSVSFFLPSSRIGEFAKRQNQTDASVEVLERNFNDIKKYYNTKYATLHITKEPQQKQIYNQEKDSNLVSEALDSIYLPFAADITPSSIINQPEVSRDIETLNRKTTNSFRNATARSIYDILKRRTSLIRKNATLIDPAFISTSIQRLIDFNQTISKRLWFLTSNRTKIDFSARNLSDIVRSMSQSSKQIFNSFTANQLSLHDYEKLALFYLNKHQFKKAIDIVAEIETKSEIPNSGFHLTNQLWLVKFEVLGKTHHHFWKTYGRELYGINKNSKFSSSYQYPHHSHNFQTLIHRYQDYKTKYHLPDSLPVTNAIIRGLGKHGDIDSLDSMVESLYGIRIDKDVYLMEHINPKKNVPSLLWPDEETLISIMLAYSRNGKLSTAIQINDLLLHHYQKNDFVPANMKKYWETTLRTVGHFGDAVDKQLINELGDDILTDVTGDSLLDLKYRFFDAIYAMAAGQIRGLNKNIIDLKMKYASVDSLVNDLPLIFETLTSSKYNTSEINIIANENTLKKYVTVCCRELAKKGMFLDANKVVDNFSPSKEVYTDLKNVLLVLQERYARDKAKEEERKRRQVDDDDDFELW